MFLVEASKYLDVFSELRKTSTCMRKRGFHFVPQRISLMVPTILFASTPESRAFESLLRYYFAITQNKQFKNTLLDDSFCFNRPINLLPPETSSKIVSWSRDNRTYCKNLYMDNILQKELTPNEICSCMAHYDEVYLVGTSHIAQFGDYIMHTCTGIDMTDIIPGLKHGTLDVGNLHFRDGRYAESLYKVLQKELDMWLSNGSRVALWFQTGCWDYGYRGVPYSLSVALDYYEKALVYAKSTAKKRNNATMDLYIISSPPAPDRKTRFVKLNEISAYVAKLEMLTQRYNVSFINEFAVVEPCNNDFARLHNNHHHYLQRHGNTFVGPVGMAFYLGVFLPTVCGSSQQNTRDMHQRVGNHL